MGKSNKKVKSDQINALRKQYDSFLEDDKKRKERNEYILGKLDKMVYSTALVPTRRTVIPAVNRSSSMYHLVYQPEMPVTRVFQPTTFTKQQMNADIPIQQIDDSYLIKEISKNYILIPKLRSSFMNNYIQHAPPIRHADTIQNTNDLQEINSFKSSKIQPSSNENTDWKSKYEILNILKKEEKEKQNVKFADKLEPVSMLNKEIVQTKTHEEIVANSDDNKNSFIYSETGNQYLSELPEKDISDEKVTYNETNEISVNDSTFTETIKPIMYVNADITNKTLPANTEAVSDIDYQLQNTNLEYNYTDTSGLGSKPLDEDISNAGSRAKYTYTVPTDPTLASDQAHYVEHAEPIHNINITTEEDSAKQNDATIYVMPEEKNQNAYLDQQYNSGNAYLEHQHNYENAYVEQAENNDNVYVSNAENNETVYIEHADNENSYADRAINNDNVYQEPGDDSIYNSGDLAAQYESVDVEKRVNIEQPDGHSGQAIYASDLNEEAINTNRPDSKENTLAQEEETTADSQDSPNTAPEQYETDQSNIDIIDGSTFDPELPQTIVPEVMENVMDTDESVAVAGIEDFDAEQRDMFYSEHSNENYGYQQDNVNTDEQGYQGNEPYQQDQDYYEGALPQQVYPVDLGEDEEQNLRYDQSYHQQYVNPDEETYKQEEPKPEQYEEQQVYDQIQPAETETLYNQQSYESVDQVQTFLDNEEGYIEPVPEVANAEANVDQIKKA